ncbi:hypothetical protein [Crenothrix sp.]|uniref:hypothetical protein n=1 Tax=Crenothrix sp. TaxID=3100433 RepID=UPI00374CD061
MTKQQKKNRLLVIVIFAMSIVPFAIAWHLSKNVQLLGNAHTTNKGQLITPPVTTERTDWVAMDAISAQKMNELPGRWLIVNVIPQKTCNAVCLKAILDTRQLQLMLNKDMLRTRRVVVAFDALLPDDAKQLWLKESLLWRLLDKGVKSEADYKTDNALYTTLLNPENSVDDVLISRLIGQENKETALKSDLIKVTSSNALRQKMTDIRKSVIPEGMLFLIDPLGNIMMQYEPGFDPYKVKSDLMHLLRISQIG